MQMFFFIIALFYLFSNVQEMEEARFAALLTIQLVS